MIHESLIFAIFSSFILLYYNHWLYDWLFRTMGHINIWNLKNRKNKRIIKPIRSNCLLYPYSIMNIYILIYHQYIRWFFMFSNSYRVLLFLACLFHYFEYIMSISMLWTFYDVELEIATERNLMRASILLAMLAHYEYVFHWLTSRIIL